MFEGQIEYFVKKVSADKVLLGTDIPYMDARPNIGRVVFADISDYDKNKIMKENLKGIMEWD